MRGPRRTLPPAGSREATGGAVVLDEVDMVEAAGVEPASSRCEMVLLLDPGPFQE